MVINNVSNANTQGFQIQQVEQAKESKQTSKEYGQSQQISAVEQKKNVGVQKFEKQVQFQQSETQTQNVAKQKDDQSQMLKRMEAQAVTHPAFHQIQQQQNVASKAESEKESSKVEVAGETNTGKR